MNLINFEILKNPLNWLTVLLMLIIFVMFVDTLGSLWIVSATHMPTRAVAS